jgi:uncharacterized protein YkwD
VQKHSKAAFTRALLVMALLLVNGPTAAKAAPKQRIFSLSQNQQDSRILKVWGVPACVMMNGGERPRGLYITGFTGEGLGRDLNLAVGDVLLSLNGKVLLDARQADDILIHIKSGRLKAVVARANNSAAGVTLFTPSVQYSANVLNQTYGTSSASGSASGSGSNAAGSGTYGPGSSAVTVREKVDSQTIAALEDYMFGLVNQDRAANGGLPALQRSSALSTLARKYADDMAKRKFFAHNDPDGNEPRDRARLAGIHESVWENLAMQEGNRPLRELVLRGEQQMMAEPPGQINHRGCILLPRHQCVGIGVAVVGDRVLCVQEFSPSAIP